MLIWTLLKIIAIIFIVIFILQFVWIKRLVTVVLGIFYIPLNALYVKLHTWYMSMKKKDKVIFFCFAPFYWIFVLIVSIISIPYEIISRGVE